VRPGLKSPGRAADPCDVDHTGGRSAATSRVLVMGGALVAVALLAAAAVPATRVPAVLAASALAAVAPVAGLVLNRPRQRLPQTAIGLVLALWAAGLVTVAVDPGATRTGGLFIEAGAVVAVAVICHLFRHRRRPAPSDAVPSRLEALGHRADQVVVGCVVALGCAQAVSTAVRGDLDADSWAAVISPVDVVLACLLLRFAFSRQRLPLAGGLALGTALLTCVYDTLVTVEGTRIAASGDPLNVLWVAAALGYVVSSVHPSARDLFAPATLGTRRTESARLLGLLPLAAAPVALHAVGARGAGVQLPVWVYLTVGALIGVLAIARGAQAVASSERRAEQDTLTGAANRRGLARAFAELLAEESDGGPLGRLVLLDVDDFKHVNDTLGHTAGDDLLTAIGRRLAGVVGPHGTVARSGGDEFVVLLTRGGPHPEQLVAAAFGSPFDLLAGPARLTQKVRVSAGWTPVDADSLLTRALADVDVALYAAKAAGKATVTAFEPSLREDVLGRLTILEDLREVLAGEPGAGWLEPWFQPLVSLVDDRVVGCEALVRWVHPERGVLNPAEFLDLAEEHGMAAELDARVLSGALAELARWDAAGLPPLFLSANLGRTSMFDPALQRSVEQSLADSGVAPGRLHLEITEHAALPPGTGAEALRALADLGVHVALDDFGIGYTSLDYLRQYPVSTLKLDRSITVPLQTDQTSPLLQGVVLLARSVGIDVLAEGIETAEQRRRLLDLGVGLGQGYLFARPMRAADFVAHLRRSQLVPTPRSGT